MRIAMHQAHRLQRCAPAVLAHEGDRVVIALQLTRRGPDRDPVSPGVSLQVGLQPENVRMNADLRTTVRMNSDLGAPP
jgi:hypothetical protein